MYNVADLKIPVVLKLKNINISGTAEAFQVRYPWSLNPSQSSMRKKLFYGLFVFLNR